jgi:hypothetical protein
VPKIDGSQGSSMRRRHARSEAERTNQQSKGRIIESHPSQKPRSVGHRLSR